MPTLWPDERIVNRLNQNTVYLVPRHAALQAGQEMRAEYEQELTNVTSQRDALQTNNEALEAINYALRLELARAQADVVVSVADAPDAVSQFRTGMQDVDSGLRLGSDTARQRLADVCSVMATHVMNFGAPNLWPNEADLGPTNWQRLDERMAMFANMGVEPMMVMYNYPVWMREIVNAQGVTPCDPNDPFATEGRVMPSMYHKLDEYLYAIAMRYLPQGVRWWVYGNEYKGLYMRRDGQKGWQNDEYVAQYEVFVSAMERAASDLGIASGELMLGGPYAAIRAEATPSSDTVPVGHPLHGKSYGEYRWHGLEAIEYWLTHATRKDFVAWDMGSGNATGGELTDAFTVAQTKYADMAQWVRTLTDLPIVVTEVYPKTADDDNANPQRIAAAKTIAHLSMIRAGYSMAWQWGAIGQGEGNPPNGGMLADYGESDPQPWYYAYKLLHDHFTEGANLYPVTVEGDGIYAEATDGVVVLVNMTDGLRTVAVGPSVHELAPYECKVVGR